ncbi:MAG: DUF937 domain-containing protein [Mycobacterium sp.]
MAGLDDLYAQIPVADIAQKLGVDQAEVSTAVRALVPTLVGGLQHNAANDDATASQIQSAAADHAAAGLLDGGVRVEDVDQNDGDKIVAKIFGGNNSGVIGDKLTGAGAGGGDLIKRLLPILAPIVLAYIGKQVADGAGGGSGSGGGLGDILGGILGGGSGQTSRGDNPLGDLLGGVLGGKGGGLGDLLGGLLGGKK